MKGVIVLYLHYIYTHIFIYIYMQYDVKATITTFLLPKNCWLVPRFFFRNTV